MNYQDHGTRKSDIVLFRLNRLREIMASLDPDDLAELDSHTATLVGNWKVNENIPLFLLDTLIGAVKCVRNDREAF